MNIPVFCYGLLTDFRCELFEGSKALTKCASQIITETTVCECGSDAVVNMRVIDGTVVTEENKQEVLDTQALLSKSASVNFIINTSKFSDPTAASQALDEFIDIAKVLDGAIIEIAGNTDPNPTSDPEDTYNKMLSEQRAETVKKYFVMNGIDANRIITVGNGSSNPVAPNDTEENKALNRRTDVSFKIIEQ